jgi:integrase
MLTGRVDLDPTRQLPGVKVPAQAPKPAPDDVLTTALGQIDDRTRLMILLAANAGLRRAEIAAVHTSDIQGGQLRVKGKGGKVRMVPIHPAIAEATADLEPGYVFPGNDQGHLSPDRVGRIISCALGPGWTAHTLRHRFATKGYAAGHDLFSLQRILGHSSPSTTQRYTATTDDAALAIVMAS